MSIAIFCFFSYTPFSTFPFTFNKSLCVLVPLLTFHGRKYLKNVHILFIFAIYSLVSNIFAIVYHMDCLLYSLLPIACKRLLSVITYLISKLTTLDKILGLDIKLVTNSGIVTYSKREEQITTYTVTVQNIYLVSHLNKPAFLRKYFAFWDKLFLH